jgi:hypothetical protein
VCTRRGGASYLVLLQEAEAFALKGLGALAMGPTIYSIPHRRRHGDLEIQRDLSVAGVEEWAGQATFTE